MPFVRRIPDSDPPRWRIINEPAGGFSRPQMRRLMEEIDEEVFPRRGQGDTFVRVEYQDVGGTWTRQADVALDDTSPEVEEFLPDRDLWPVNPPVATRHLRVGRRSYVAIAATAAAADTIARDALTRAGKI